jgi:hypothetical protein
MQNTEGKRLLGRSRCRWENNVKMVLREMGWCDIDWIHLAQDRDQWRALVNMVMNDDYHLLGDDAVWLL